MRSQVMPWALGSLAPSGHWGADNSTESRSWKGSDSLSSFVASQEGHEHAGLRGHALVNPAAGIPASALAHLLSGPYA